MKKTPESTSAPRQAERSGEEAVRTAYQVHTLSQLLYGHLSGQPTWAGPVSMTGPETLHGLRPSPGLRAWGAGLPTVGPQTVHGFGLSPGMPMWTGEWRAHPGLGPAAPLLCGPYCMPGFWKP